MREYYELANVTGNTNSYFVSDPSIEISNAVQDLLIQECMINQVNNILSAQINLNNYINAIVTNLENIYLQDHLLSYMENTKLNTAVLKAFMGNDDQYLTNVPDTQRHNLKSWKKDLSYVRAMQIMTGYILNFYTPAENLAGKLNYSETFKSIKNLHTNTQILHNTITKISVQLINNKFIN